MEAVKQEKPNNKDNKRKKKGIIIGSAVLGVAAVGAVTAALLVKSCEDDKGGVKGDDKTFVIKHANYTAAQTFDASIKSSQGASLTIKDWDKATNIIEVDVINADVTSATIIAANVTDAWFGDKDNVEGLVDSSNPTIVDHAKYTGIISGHFKGDVSKITGDKATGFTFTGNDWSIEDGFVNFTGTFSDLFATKGNIIDNTASGTATKPTSTMGFTAINQPLTQAQINQNVQSSVQNGIPLNTPLQTGQTPTNVVTNVLNNIAKSNNVPNPTNILVTPTPQTSGQTPLAPWVPQPYTVTYTPAPQPATPSNPHPKTPSPVTIQVMVPPTPLDSLKDVKVSTNNKLDETNFDKLSIGSFDVTDAPQGTTIKTVTPPSSIPNVTPGQTQDIDYKVTVEYQGATKDITVKVPYTAPTQKTINQRLLDKVIIASKITLHETGYASPDATNVLWTNTLDENSFAFTNVDQSIIATGLKFKTAETNADPDKDKVVNFTVELKSGTGADEVTKTFTVPVNYKAPSQADINQAAANAATVNLSTPTTLNESNWNNLKENDFKAISPRTDISITKVTVPNLNKYPSQDGDITYDVEVTVGTGNDAKTSTKQVSVPYKALLSGLTVSTQKTVNDDNWDKLDKNDFSLNTPGITIESVQATGNKPTNSGDLVTYKVHYKLGSIEGDKDVQVNYVGIKVSITATKTVDENSFDKLSIQDFDLKVVAPAGLSGAFISKVTPPTKPNPLADGNITYVVTWTYNSFSHDENVDVDLKLTDLYHVQNATVSSKVKRNFSNWDQLKAADLDIAGDVTVADSDIKLISKTPDPNDKTITSIRYEVTVHHGQATATKTVDVAFGVGAITHKEYYEYNNHRYDIKVDALAAAKTGEEAKITTVERFVYKTKQYNTQPEAAAAQHADIVKEILSHQYDGAPITTTVDASTQTVSNQATVYVYNGLVFDTIDNAKIEWLKDHQDKAAVDGKLEIKYDNNVIETITLDKTTSAVYANKVKTESDAKGNFKFAYVETKGTPEQLEVIAQPTTLPASPASGQAINIDGTTYTYHTVGEVTAASTTGTKYTAASIASAIEGQVNQSTDNSKSVNIDGTVYKFENVIEKRAQAYTLDQILNTVGNHKVTIDGKDYWNAVEPSKEMKFGLLQKDATGQIVTPTGMSENFSEQLSSIGMLTVDARVKNTSSSSFNDVTKAVTFVSNEQMVKLDTWLNTALTKLQTAKDDNDLSMLDNWNGADEDNWMWFWNSFAKEAVQSYVDQTGKTIDVDAIFDGSHDDLIAIAQKTNKTQAAFYDNIITMATALGCSQEETDVYQLNPTNKLGTGTAFYSSSVGQKMKGIAFATSTPSKMFTNQKTGEVNGRSAFKDTPGIFSPVHSMKALLSYWNSYTQRMVAIGKGGVFATNQILTQTSSNMYAGWMQTLESFETQAANDEGIKNLSNSIISNSGDVFMLSLGNVVDWANSSLSAQNNGTHELSPFKAQGAGKNATIDLPTTPNIFSVNDAKNLGAPLFFILRPRLSIDLSSDQDWLDFAKRNFADEIKQVDVNEVKINGQSYKLTGYEAKEFDPSFVGLYDKEPTWIFDHFDALKIKPVDKAAFNDTIEATSSNGLLTVTTNLPVGPFYKLNGDKYTWTTKEKDKGTEYVAPKREWDTIIPTGDYYKVADTSKFATGVEYTTNLQDGVEDYTVVKAAPATNGWYKEASNAITDATLPFDTSTTVYRKGNGFTITESNSSDHINHSPSSQKDFYKLVYTKTDGTTVDVNVAQESAIHDANATLGTNGANAPTVDQSKISFTWADFVPEVVWDFDKDSKSGNDEVKTISIIDDLSLVSQNVAAGHPLQESAVNPAGQTFTGYAYDGKIYVSQADAEAAFQANVQNTITSQNLKLEYNKTTYQTEAEATTAADNNSIKLVEQSLKTEYFADGVKFTPNTKSNPSLKVNVILATQDPKDMYK